MENNKKNEARIKANKKWESNQKRIVFRVPDNEFDVIKAHAESKGYSYLSEYIKVLIDNDMKKHIKKKKIYSKK